MKENGHMARGVDYNRTMVGLCKECGLDVTESDAIACPRNQESNQFGCITGFYVIEHLPPRILEALFDRALRTLRPGGVVIFETTNPENLIVGACNFYCDLTHKKPLPPDLPRFLAEQRGFVRAEILKLRKVKKPQFTSQASINEIIARTTIEQDYSVIGYKA